MKAHKTSEQGFTLIEVMIVCAIFAILAAIGYPAYTEQIKKSRRKDAQSALIELSGAMERYKTTNSNYDGTATSRVPNIFPSEVPLDSSSKYYDLKITEDDTIGNPIPAGETRYALVALPKNSQAGDGCIFLKSNGERGWEKNVANGFCNLVIGAGEETW